MGEDETTDPDVSKTKQIANLHSAIQEMRDAVPPASSEVATIKSNTILGVVEKVTELKVLVALGVIFLVALGICAGVWTKTYDFGIFAEKAAEVGTEMVP
jgi:hypothetical protein